MMNEPLPEYGYDISQRPQPIDVEKRIIDDLRSRQPEVDPQAVERRIKAESVAIELYKCLGGNLKFLLLTPLISRKSRCERLLSGLTAQQLGLVREAFTARYDESLESALKRSAFGTWRSRLVALSNGDLSANLAHAIYYSLRQFLITRRSDRFLDSLESKLWSLADGERANVIASFNSLYREQLGGRELRINEAEERPPRSDTGRSFGPGGGGGRGGGEGGDRARRPLKTKGSRRGLRSRKRSL